MMVNLGCMAVGGARSLGATTEGTSWLLKSAAAQRIPLECIGCTRVAIAAAVWGFCVQFIECVVLQQVLQLLGLSGRPWFLAFLN